MSCQVLQSDIHLKCLYRSIIDLLGGREVAIIDTPEERISIRSETP